MSNNKDIESGSAPQGASQPSALARYGLPVGLFGASVILGITLPVCLHNKTQTDLKDLEKKLGKAQYEELLKKTEELTKRVNYLEAQKPKTEIQTDKPKTIKPKTIKPKTIKPKTIKPKTIQTNTIDVQTDNIQTNVIETQTANPIQADFGTDPEMSHLVDVTQIQRALDSVRTSEWRYFNINKTNQNRLFNVLQQLKGSHWHKKNFLNKDMNDSQKNQIFYILNIKSSAELGKWISIGKVEAKRQALELYLAHAAKYESEEDLYNTAKKLKNAAVKQKWSHEDVAFEFYFKQANVFKKILENQYFATHLKTNPSINENMKKKIDTTKNAFKKIAEKNTIVAVAHLKDAFKGEMKNIWDAWNQALNSFNFADHDLKFATGTHHRISRPSTN